MSGGARQARQQAYEPRFGPADLLSDDAKMQVADAERLQREAAQDPELNGQAARGRVRGND